MADKPGPSPLQKLLGAKPLETMLGKSPLTSVQKAIKSIAKRK